MKVKHNHPTRDLQTGFTVVELMIATSILSVILLTVSVMMVNIGRLYYKGINQARIQSDLRNITDDVSQHLKLSAGNGDLSGLNSNAPDGTPCKAGQALPAGGTCPGPTRTEAYCVGTTRYSYRLNLQQSDTPADPADQTRHVVWRDTLKSGDICQGILLSDWESAASTPSEGGTEMMGPRSRLTIFNMDQQGNGTYLVHLKAAYGDSELLSGSGRIPDTLCLGGADAQFCATAELSTNISRRL